jgi:hypothetical protein
MFQITKTQFLEKTQNVPNNKNTQFLNNKYTIILINTKCLKITKTHNF